MKKDPDIRVTKKSLYSWVFYKTVKWQVLLIGIILITVAARVFPLEMQKRIINEAIGMRMVDKLVLYCGLYLAAVVLAGVLKFAINCIQTYIGQKTLIHLRRQLYEHILSLPLPFFRRTQPGLVISTLVAELAAVANFIGQAVAVPVVNLLTLLAFGSYMFYLDPLLAALSLAIYPLEVLIIPFLQKRANQSNRKRIDATRDTSSFVGESISGVHEVHANASVAMESNKFTGLIDRLYRHNLRMNIYKYAVKFTNNLFQSMGPFVLFLVGGYLSIQGRFDLGALVAFLSAFEKVYDPWKELMDFYQVYQDAKVRYRQVMGYFDIKPDHKIKPKDRAPLKLEGGIEVNNISYVVEGNIKLLNDISLSLKPGEQMALVGFSGGGKSTLALAIGQLYKYTTGSVKVGGREVEELAKQDMANNIGFVPQHPFIFNGSVKENLLYSCEALSQGDPEGGHIIPDLDRMIEAVQQVGLFLDVLSFGLRTVIAADEEADLVKTLITVRENFQRDYGRDLADDVEFYDPDNYLFYSSVAANITFGASRKKEYAHDMLYLKRDFRKFLKDQGLEEPLMSLGVVLALETVDILQHLTPSPDLFEQSPISMEEFESYQALTPRLKEEGVKALDKEEKLLILKLALAFIPAQHKMASAPEDLMERVVEARAAFAKDFLESHSGTFSIYRPSEYIHSRNILENLLFGKIKSDSGGAADRVNQSLMQLLIMENILEEIVEMGFHFQVGSQGDRLSGGQRQKIALARAFLKEPPILIMDEATAALDNASQARIQNLLETKWKGRSTLISVVHRLDIVKGYDKIVVLKAGCIIETGSYNELMARKGALYELVNGAK